MFRIVTTFLFTLILSFLSTLESNAQTAKTGNKLSRPKIVVGIVVDQMRWDFLYRYYDRYGDDGFKRLLKEGFSCENTFINYLPSYTGVGHAAVFTGSVPAINGITGNNWIDQQSGKTVYCTDDSTVQTVGSTSAAGKMSPRNLWTSTITDELRLATNNEAKVVGVSLKDRASILPAGHMANGAFWLDDATGDFITSTYYMEALPEWVKSFNRDEKVSRLMEKPWKTLYPIDTYKNSTEDQKPYEGMFEGETSSTFPHDLKTAYAHKKSSFRSTPFGNTLILDFAKAAIAGYSLGQGNTTDFLTVNFASTDYVGHQFGPNAMEIEDTYLRLDKELGEFFKYLDAEIGEGNYMVFLTADHGAAHAAEFMRENKLPGGLWNSKAIKEELNRKLAETYGVEGIIRAVMNYQVHFEWPILEKNDLDIEKIKDTAIAALKQHRDILYAIDIEDTNSQPIPKPVRRNIINGYHFKRSGSIQFALKPGYIDTLSKTGTTHGSGYPYDMRIPLVFMGWGIESGVTHAPVFITDIAPTIAALLHIQVPNGSVGQPVPEVLD